ncbi:MAG: Eco57I restriction-modification methylase domain-containing protein [Spirosoma sp.]|nr:Eco57I restriction-modification methylase domain-containing protein [Spirosoma sp.]
MTESELKDILRQRYSLARWQELLQLFFTRIDLFPSSGYSPLFESVDFVRKAFQYGVIYLEKDKRLAVIDIELTDNKVINRNRAQLRELVATVVNQNTAHGVLAIFHGPNQLDYRLSLIVKTPKFVDGEFIVDQTYPKRYTYVLGPNESCTTAARQLLSLSTKNRLTIEDITNAFSVEKVSTEFFKEYKYNYEKKFLVHLTRLAGQTPELLPVTDDTLNRKEREEKRAKLLRDFCKRLMGRVVFLYFVQKKGWLGAESNDNEYKKGDPAFLQTLFREFDQLPQQTINAYYRDWLSVLFFGTLNKRRPNDAFTMPSGRTVRVPYLNGGLFDDQSEPDASLINFPPTFFHNANQTEVPNERGLFDFMDSFNFTVYEDSPDDQTVAVDPEMLGHIFENLLEENRSKGAIYTPKEFVHFMCQQSLTEYLKTHLPTDKRMTDAIGQLVRDKSTEGIPAPLLDQVDGLLKQVRICDPAIGSGAFPIGLLQEIFAIQEAINLKRGYKVWSPATVKKQIIQQSIYGVDLDAGAVDIARLRFWLALVVDEEQPKELPNLDYKIMQGNSLLERFETIDLSKLSDLQEEGDVIFAERSQYEIGADFSKSRQAVVLFDRVKKEELLELINSFYNETDPVQKREKKARISEIVDGRIHYQLRMDRVDLERKLTKLQNDLRRTFGPDFQNLVNAKSEQGKTLQKLTKQLAESQAKENRLLALQHTDDRPYFLWKLYFQDVLLTDQPGFDIVIANPPYMRVQEVEKVQPREKLQYENEAYGYKVAKGSYDLANLFVELALTKLSNEHTVNCFIFPHKFFNASGAEAFREFLIKGQYVDKIAHFGANRVFNDVDTYVCIALLSKSKQAKEAFSVQKFPFGSDFRQLMTDESRYQSVSYDKLRRAAKLYGGNQPWIIFGHETEYDLLEEMYANTNRRLEEVVEIFVGLQTSNDKLYLLDVTRQDDRYFWGTNQLSNEVWQVEKTFFKPLLRGRDVQRYAPLQTTNYVFFPYQVTGKSAKPVPLRVLETQYPDTYRYVMEQADVFKARESGKAAKMEFWYEYIYPKNLIKFEQRKLSSMEICTSYPNVTLNNEHLYHTTTVYSWVKRADTSESYEYLLAIANSSLLWWFLKNTGDTLQGDARRMKSNYLNPFPLPAHVSPATEKAIATLVRYLLFLNDPARPAVNPSVNNTSVATYMRQVVDGCVFELYFGEHMRTQKIDILSAVEREVKPIDELLEKVQAECINAVFLAWQRSESEVRNRLKLFTTRSPDQLALILNA